MELTLSNYASHGLLSDVPNFIENPAGFTQRQLAESVKDIYFRYVPVEKRKSKLGLINIKFKRGINLAEVKFRKVSY